MKYIVRDQYELLSNNDNLFFVMNTDSCEIFLINSTGWFILNHINGKSVEDLVSELKKEIVDEIDEFEIEKDVNGFIEILLEQKILSIE